MAKAKVLRYGDETLRKPSKEVHKITSRIKKLVDTLIETMYLENGVGLAAPQVGENYRIFVIDVSDPNGPIDPMVFINPKIIEKSGAVNSYEGCLSFPQAFTNVRRYANVTVVAKDLSGRTFKIEAKDGTLLARAIQHETDHLDGILFIDHLRNRFETNQELADKGLLPVNEKYLLNEEDLEKQIQEIPAPQPEEETV